MKILVVGAGMGGLAAAVRLLEKGHQVVVMEMSDRPGGLANGYMEKGWKWSVEKFYHHIFVSDKSIIELSKKVGCPVVFKKPLTSVRFGGTTSQLDDPISLLKSPMLSIVGKLWMATGLLILKLIPDGLASHLERYQAMKALPYLLGQEGFEKIWRRLLTAKFGKYVDEVNMAWFWARVAKRSQALGYFEGGFEMLAYKTVEHIKKLGGEVRYGAKIEKISVGEKVKVMGGSYDKVIVTIPAPYIEKMFEGKIKFPKLNYLWGQTLILRLRKSLMRPYWLNVLEKDWPFLVCVEHTNFVDKKYYNNERLIYLGNYLADDDKLLAMNDSQLFKHFWNKLTLINPNLKKSDVKGYVKFQAHFAQPVFPTNYSRKLPSIKQFGDKVLIANMSMVYPFDRGTNYAVALGEKAASLVD